ncbi:minor capsid protein [Sporosarcina psychrophila]|uniref:SPP1 gp7 family putative phage head morphogenesis protein n=1 Tax=Sporosarcina psychrophila TaxID=1476 RepID=A0ABV2KF13_SPOPS
MKTRSNAYWDKRSLQRMAEYHRGADSTVQIVNAAYDKAQKDIAAETQKIFDKFAKDGKLSAEEAQKILNEPISKVEWESIKSKINDIQDPAIKRQMLNRLNAPAYSARITRLEALKENTYLQSKIIIADTEIRASTTGYIGTINDAYYQTMFDVQKGLLVGFDFASMPTSRVEAILKNPWTGKQFSERIWDNTDVLASQVTDIITAGFMSGAGTAQMSRELAERMNVGKHAANRLVRTETTYMANMAEMESYGEAEIDEYMFLATLDKKTSVICQKQDLKVYKVKDAMPGVNMPPMHPFCRSTTRAYFGPKTLENIERRARDPITGKNELIPAGTNYEQWREGLDEKHGKDKIDTIQKQIKNKAADKKQFDQFKEVLGKDAPKSFAAFQDLKYNNAEKWASVKLDKRRKSKQKTT